MNLLKGDCLERMKEIESGSVDAIICDPPFGTMDTDGGRKLGVTGWDSVIDHEDMLEECNRILRPNGALVLFGQEPYTSKLVTQAHGNLPFSYRMTWLKDNFANALGCKKAPVNYTEDVCVFFKRYEDKTGHPLQEYFSDQLALSGMTSKEMCKALGTTHASHFFTKGVQFRTPNSEYLKKMQEMTGMFSIEYSEVDATQKAFLKYKREKYPTTFNLPEGKKYKSNVLEYKKDYHGLHPTAKPVLLMEDLVKTYTNEGDTVLDFTMGSGSTGVGCANTGREFIGIERDEGYFAIAQERIEKAHKDLAQAEFEKQAEMF